MAAESHPHHAIDYVELSTNDFDKVEAFYTAVFGWRFNRYGPKYMGFIDNARGDQEAGGFALVDDASTNSTTAPLVILYSDDLEASRRAVLEAGGLVVTQNDIEEGRFKFTDPTGMNTLACWSHAPDAKDKAPHHIHHTIAQIDFSAANLEETEAFFAAAFGWRVDRCATKSSMAYFDGARGGEQHGRFELVDCRAADAPQGPLVVIYSDSLHESLAAVKEAGGVLTQDIFDVPGGQRFEFKDPTGNAFACWRTS
eukprot:TRINITY_DN77095_c0_g1_i1.p1 TRINITY_DN77095_c0_g1~~TRINITY_DN77095_c0_g1_i1.p1  ORF type:complete len:275 (-),score=3.61 TRINITY_DN77095_c0_g1_i1:53-817(-)